MGGLVEPPALEVVAHLLGDRQAEAELGSLAEGAAQTVVIHRWLIADCTHQGNELATQLRKKTLTIFACRSLIRSPFCRLRVGSHPFPMSARAASAAPPAEPRMYP